MQTASINRHPASEAFLLPGGSIGILILHGYGGSIGDYRSCAEQLHRLGYTVQGVRLAGHGNGLNHLRQTTVGEMFNSVKVALHKLSQHCSTVVVIGSSFGGTLALALAEQLSVLVQGVVVVNPALAYRGGGRFQGLLLRLLRLFTPYYSKRGLTKDEQQQAELVGSTTAWPIDGIIATSNFARETVLPRLDHITQPLLVLESSVDQVVATSQNEYLLAAVATKEPQRQILPLTTHRPFRHPEAVMFMVKAIHNFIQGRVVKNQ